MAATRGLTPLVGREPEVGLLDRWAQVKDGQGQVVLLSGEAGIGKSPLVQVLKERLAGEPHLRWECRCSPYYQHSALYPVIDLFQRALQFARDDPPEAKLGKLEEALGHYHVSIPQVVPFFASLLSLPLPARYPPLTFTPQRQRQKTLEAVLAVLLGLASQRPVLFIVEDLHWVDPSTLDLLGLLIDQGPTARILTLLTRRPAFRPPWALRSHLTPMVLSRLPRPQVERMVEEVAGGKALPAEVFNRCPLAWSLCYLGDADQALTQVQQGLALAQELAHPPSPEYALSSAARVHQLRREAPTAQAHTAAALAIADEQGFAQRLAGNTILRGWGLSRQGQVEEGISQITQGIAAFRATGAEAWRHYWLALLAEASGTAGQRAQGLTYLAEALTLVVNNGECFYEAELHRLKGELLLQQPLPVVHQAITCFRHTLDVAHQSPAARATRGREVEAGVSPRHPPAGDESGGSSADHPAPPRGRPDQWSCLFRHHPPVPGFPPHALRCRLERRQLAAHAGGGVGCASWHVVGG